MLFFWGNWLWALLDLHVALITILDVAEKSSFKWRRTHKEYTIKWSSSGRPQEEIVCTVSNANEIKYKNKASLFVCRSIDVRTWEYVCVQLLVVVVAVVSEIRGKGISWQTSKNYSSTHYFSPIHLYKTTGDSLGAICAIYKIAHQMTAIEYEIRI